MASSSSSSAAAAPASKLRVGYIPEHFASPLLLLSRTPWGEANLELVSQPAGTGQVLTSFDASSAEGQKIDVAIALTEALIAGIAKGRQDLKLVGSYVKTPLVWAVSTGTSPQAEKYQSIDDLRGTTLGISRVGSGSQIMASVMALQRSWPTGGEGAAEEGGISFHIDNTFPSLRSSVNTGRTSAFMWETFTTKPFYDSGEVRKIGEVPTPWPSWTIAASTNTALASLPSRALLDDFLHRLQGAIVDFTSQESLRESRPEEFIIKELGYQRKDVEDWLKTVRWVGDGRGSVSDTPTLGQTTST